MPNWKDILKIIFVPDARRRATLPLFNFTEESAYEVWKHGSDSVYGGYSTCTFGPNATKSAALFTGSISTKLPEKTYFKPATLIHPKRRLIRSGFAACKAPVAWYTRVTIFQQFNGIELVARGDNKVYDFNVTPSGYGVDDIYKVQFNLSSSTKWIKLILKFEDMTLLSGGKLKYHQRTLDHGKIDAVGVSISDQEGDFNLEIKSISMVATDLLPQYSTQVI